MKPSWSVHAIKEALTSWEWSSAWEASSFSASQITLLLWNPTLHICTRSDY